MSDFTDDFATVLSRMRSQIAARVTDISALAPRGIIDVMTTAVAGAVYTIHGYIEYMLRQILPDTATGKYLERHGAMWGVAASEARRAMGVVFDTRTIPAGTVLVSDQGVEYELIQDIEKFSLPGVGVVPGPGLVVAKNTGVAGNIVSTEAKPAELILQSIMGASGTVPISYYTSIGPGKVGFVIARGTDGSTVPQFTELLAPDGGVFITLNPVALNRDGYFALNITPISLLGPSQFISDVSPGTPLTFTDPPPGVDPVVYVADAGIYGGADEQTEQKYRQSILDRMRQPPQGGSMADYRRWVRESPGVRAKNVWVFGHPDTAPGTVEVYFTTLDGLPSGADVIAAQGYIEHMKPVGTRVTVSVPKTKDIDITISTLIAPGYDRLDVVEQIRQEIAAEFADYEMQSTPHTMPISVIYRALAQVAGLKKYAITSITGGSLQGVDMPAFTLPTLGVLDA